MVSEKVLTYQSAFDQNTPPAKIINRLQNAIKLTQGYLIKAQHPEGYWVGELESDCSVSAGYIWLMYFMTGSVDPLRQTKVVNYLLSKQQEDGSWCAYYGGPGDINVTIQVYFSLKLAGISSSEKYMQKARQFILSSGGMMKANTITRIWLSIFGQFDYRGTPSIPPEIVLLPKWFYFNIYEFASWSRETIMALIIILTTKPVCKVPGYADISELYLEPETKRNYRLAKRGRIFSWSGIFLGTDFILKLIEKQPLHPFRKISLEKVEKWVVAHQEADGSWGGIMLPWIYSLMALKSLGYKPDSPVISKGMAGLATFIVEDIRTCRMQPAVSPVWDTSWSVFSLLESGLPADHPSVTRAGKWLLKKEIKKTGDWKIKNPRSEYGGWAFEFINDLYPDVDDTALVARTLAGMKLTKNEEPGKIEAAKRGLQWIKDMQSSDGGWAAFDRDNNKQILANVPYADFMTPLDPTCADVTAHAIELLSILDPESHSIKRALKYLKQTQKSDGSWYGRWGVNYIYGTGLVLSSLKTLGENPAQKYISRAVDWLIAHQNPDGGWGETCETYQNTRVSGRGPSTASQTAWALMGLIAAGKSSSLSAEKGVNFLLSSQLEDGTWEEKAYTGTGFPRAFYLRYDLYRIYFPLLVLGQYRNSLEEKMDSLTEQLSRVAPYERILLLPHCLRQSNTCCAKYDSRGLQCAGCNPECSVNILRTRAIESGYKGVCVAPGGRLAIKFVKESHPKAIVAVACDKELEEGVQGIKQLATEEFRPVIVIVPLVKDGCIDTIVDADKALEIISTGCIPVAVA